MRSAEIKGLPIFSIADGKEIGKVRELLINAEKKAVDYLLVDIPDWYFAAVIPFGMIEGIGTDAVMVETKNIVKKLSEEADGIKLAESGISLIGTRVLTRKGHIIGKIVEFIVNENNGKIAGCELVDNNATAKGIIPTALTLTFGKDVLVVRDEVENYLLSNLDEAEALQIEPSSDVDMTVQATNEELETAPLLQAPEPEAKESTPAKGKGVELFEQKQREYLLGRTVNKDICDAVGKVIIQQGVVITDELIEKAIVAGTFKELMVSV